MSGNSHQRRRAKRHWRHLYYLENIKEYDVFAEIIRDWCKEHFSSKGYGRRWGIHIYRQEEYSSAFCVAFRNDKDASWFIMKWVEHAERL